MKRLFRTVVPTQRLRPPISHMKHVFCIGSCFARNIGGSLETFRFPSLCNPTGILFNPLSIEIAIRRLLEKKRFDYCDLFFHNGRWHSFDHHSSYDGNDRDVTLAAINESFDRAADRFPRTDVLMLTFGTAVVFRHRTTDRVVANCHKLPQVEFERQLVPTMEIAALYTSLIADLLALRPGLRIILTVSPVRHLRDDPHENSVSKARLIEAVFDLESRFEQVYYFPAWEIMMDELRDYRFYAEDMAHPAGIAVEYIWEKFCEACIADRSLEFIREYEPVLKAMQHRIQEPDTAPVHEFLARHIGLISSLRKKYPEIDLSPAVDHFARSGG
ncbi:MAG: GSCFA domain-containing protein [Chitinispirillaceae bacterium]|nr:GSCFA domain-containing protein [Chitinispirillaceae bacterium]